MDDSLYLDANRLSRATPWAHHPIAQYALWGGLVLLAVLLAAGWARGRLQRDAPDQFAIVFLTGLSTVVAVLANQRLLSPLVARPRPFVSHPHALVLLTRSHDYSFPSDHCVIAGAFAVGLWTLDRTFGVLAAILAVALAFGRVYAGMHYPADTLIGLLVGAALCAVAVRTGRASVRRLAVAAMTTPLRPIVASRSIASTAGR
jgi:membrane-associated phospholipid phosphatase